MKKRFVIYHSGLFDFGYVKFGWTGKDKSIPLPSMQKALDFSTKFKYRFLADFACKILNKSSERNYSFSTYSVKVLEYFGDKPHMSDFV